jgi:molybdate transport system permease protein
MLVFLIVPVVAMLIRALQDADSIDVLRQRSITSAISLSLGTTALSVILTLVFGTPLAFLLARTRFRFKRFVNVLVELPVVLPPVVAGFGLLLAFGRRGIFGPSLMAIGITLPFTTLAVVVAQTFVAAPFFIRAAQVRFASIPRDLEDAASIDGAGMWAFFRFVAIPLSAPGMLAGLVLAWARALGEFGATILFAGSLQGRTQTMPLLIYGALESSINSALWASLILVALAVTAMLIARWMTRSFDEEL